jgi:hypothetical protein
VKRKERERKKKGKVNKYRTTRSKILEMGWEIAGVQEDKRAKGNMNGPNEKKLLRVQCVAFLQPLIMGCSKSEVEVEVEIEI